MKRDQSCEMKDQSMLSLRDLIKRLLALTPYRLVHSAPNRFQAIDYCLQHLGRLGYAPRRIIDGGAHLGWFAQLARKVFPQAAIHMIDPQPACGPALAQLAATQGFHFHPVALGAVPGRIVMHVADTPSTGAHVRDVGDPESKAVDVEAATLDGLFAADCTAADRTFLKLDLEGHEMPALRGASRLLPQVEVVLIESSFLGGEGEPRAPELIAFFSGAGFDLFDIASLSGRPRDNRLRQADLVFVRRGSPLLADTDWA